jgi:AcrR family transcriptional regulator
VKASDADEPPHDVPTPVDGRVARKHATRERIVEAHAALLREGDLHPSAAAVAARAGVSVRALWVNFKDVEGLRAATTSYWIAADDSLTRRVDPALPIGERIEAFCAQRQRRLEAMAPAARSSMIALHRSPELARSRRIHLDRLRAEVERTFAPEIKASNNRSELLEALVVAASWTTWLLLRDDLGLDAAASGRLVRRLMASLLGDLHTGACHGTGDLS